MTATSPSAQHAGRAAAHTGVAGSVEFTSAGPSSVPAVSRALR